MRCVKEPEEKAVQYFRGLSVAEDDPRALGAAIGETRKSPQWQYHEFKVDPRKALVRDAYDAIAPVWGEKRREVLRANVNESGSLAFWISCPSVRGFSILGVASAFPS
jgi:hypothetical protein